MREKSPPIVAYPRFFFVWAATAGDDQSADMTLPWDATNHILLVLSVIASG